MTWRDDKPTDAQLATIDKWGIDPGTLTKGEVSDLITQELNERRTSPLRHDDWDDNDNVYDDEDLEDHDFNDLNDWKKGW